MHRQPIFCRQAKLLRLSGNKKARWPPLHYSEKLWPLVQRLVLDFRAVSAKDAIEVVNEIP